MLKYGWVFITALNSILAFCGIGVSPLSNGLGWALCTILGIGMWMQDHPKI